MEIPNNIYQKIIEEGEKQLPYEACGFISGQNNKVRSFWPLVNEIRSRHRFFVSKSKVHQKIQEIHNTREQLYAVFHSHPTTAAIPSSYDLRNHPVDSIDMVIVSYKLDSPQLKWFQIDQSSYKNISWLLSS
ncbi:Proteasome lid subunit RPN8/RPN11, contains Jab1/MPN metalloenzyme (JAMM) motif [Gracilibacillus kekensis]|uniref:Proteasome lid subunit RPN8/RPN11, contains Jab1/MPN metalloenzyme (JAMM) motif n=2 Tax=Gracilibacillus kekensis TaxID=1027249 RepID=A0A1M7NT59_9BACI|nr:Proteasome lid subunit RPN8/RPN11, contains Jab1/MPN metalloenzyme (JAMM) motif [Gracilibacillus kekensis]